MYLFIAGEFNVFLLKNFIEVQLIYTVVFHFCGTVKWLSYTYTFFFMFFSTMVYHKLWNTVLRVLQ